MSSNSTERHVFKAGEDNKCVFIIRVNGQPRFCDQSGAAEIHWTTEMNLLAFSPQRALCKLASSILEKSEDELLAMEFDDVYLAAKKGVESWKQNKKQALPNA